MPDTTSVFDITGLTPETITVLSGTKMIKLFAPQEDSTVNITLTIVEKTK
jgi:hypothetical protein